jgi:hypothetical protein
MREGVLVACSQNLERFLPWWWLHYRAHNSFPVAFVDFGLSLQGQEWCRKRGSLLPLSSPDFSVVLKEDVFPETAALWERCYGSGFWGLRRFWFKKPLAMRHTPFRHTIWCDLDCQIRGSLEPLFAYSLSPQGLAAAREIYPQLSLLRQGETEYNAGVVVYQDDSPVLAAWAEECVHRNALHIGDQHALSRVLFERGEHACTLPALYNWSRMNRPDPRALIIHWHGGKGKENILQQMAFLHQRLFVDWHLGLHFREASHTLEKKPEVGHAGGAT